MLNAWLGFQNYIYIYTYPYCFEFLARAVSILYNWLHIMLNSWHLIKLYYFEFLARNSKLYINNRTRLYIYNRIQLYTIVYKCLQSYTWIYIDRQLYTIVHNCINSIRLIIYNFEFPAGNSKLYYFEFPARDSKFLNSRPGIQNYLASIV